MTQFVADSKQGETLAWLVGHCRCPDCHSRELRIDGPAIVCEECTTAFPINGQRPVLMRTDNTVFPRSSYTKATSGDSNHPLLRAARHLVPSRSVNMTNREALNKFAETLPMAEDSTVLVIGAGSQRDWLKTHLASRPHLRVLCSDVDVRAEVDLFCDAHELPFPNESVDGIVASAVLEHVLYPERAVAEMHRVLRSNGTVYTEIPFLQQVHEGAYDFTRYTLSGHRRLMNNFDELASGVVAGPGTTLAWALEQFAVSFSPKPLTSIVRFATRCVFFWLKYADYLAGQSPAAVDGASCTYFLGRRARTSRPDTEIIAQYSGLKQLRHV